jgi:cell wall-associated NlpC family hydrolase
MPIPFWVGRYIGVPFREHGRDASGADCWGLVRLVYLEQFSTCLPSLTAFYERTTSTESIHRLILRESQKWQLVRQPEAVCGDVIVLRLRGVPMHVGMVIGDDMMLHVENGTNSAIEKYTHHRWKDRVFGFYRYKDGGDDTENF